MSTTFTTTYGRAPFVKAQAGVNKALAAHRVASDAERVDTMLALYCAYVRLESVGTGNAADAAERVNLLALCRTIIL